MIMEPSAEDRRRRVSAPLVHGSAGLDSVQIRPRLRDLRLRVRHHHRLLQHQFEESLRSFPGIGVTVADTARTAAERIRTLAGNTDWVSINRSNVILNEIRPELHSLGLKTRERYFREFGNFDPATFVKRFVDYWSAPDLENRGLAESFAVQREYGGLPVGSVRDYTAVLGVNSVSAADGTVLFLQHASNIAKDLEEAGRIILVVTKEKIVPDLQAALFHTMAMGVFGMESLLLGLTPNPLETFDPESLPVLREPVEREIHLIILDNGRTALLDGDYGELFLCIDCRACARQCPIGSTVAEESDRLYSPKNYVLAYLQGSEVPLNACLHCGRCKVECPVDIDLPSLIWRTQIDDRARKGASLAKHLLDNPEWLMMAGGAIAPLSNWAVRLPPVRWLMEHLAGVHRKARMPVFQRTTFQNWYRHHGRA
jgi:ferredoxin